MADTLQMSSTGLNGSDQFLESLERLSKKEGVLAILVLDRANGAILNRAGSLSSLRGQGTSSLSNSNASSEEGTRDLAKSDDGLESMASAVFKYISATKDFIGEVDGQDELKLLRLRTKKYELVIVPDPKYLLVVVHEMPTN